MIISVLFACFLVLPADKPYHCCSVATHIAVIQIPRLHIFRTRNSNITIDLHRNVIWLRENLFELIVLLPY